jgi:hypothetical protein
VIPGESSYGFQNPKAMQKLSGRQLLGVAASIVLARHVDQALQNAFEVPDSVVDVARFCDSSAAGTDTKTLNEWAKAHAKGMPLAEIARSYGAKIEDVAGALGVAVPTQPAKKLPRPEYTAWPKLSMPPCPNSMLKARQAMMAMPIWLSMVSAKPDFQISGDTTSTRANKPHSTQRPTFQGLKR